MVGVHDYAMAPEEYDRQTDRQTDKLSVHHSKLMQRTLQKCAESFVPGEYSRIAEKPVVFHTASYIFIYLVKIYSHLTCR